VRQSVTHIVKCEAKKCTLLVNKTTRHRECPRKTLWNSPVGFCQRRYEEYGKYPRKTPWDSVERQYEEYRPVPWECLESESATFIHYLLWQISPRHSLGHTLIIRRMITYY